MSALKTIAIGLLALLAIFAISAAAWAISVAVSGPKGQGDAIKTKNSSQNWTTAQARFEDLYAGIQAADKKAENAAAVLAKNPQDKTYQQTYSGIVSGCTDLVAHYNAESRKFLAADFKSADLPYQIDQTDPAFDCKENTK
jgi:hypothetical protein